MASTQHLNIFPDYYETEKESREASKVCGKANERYRNFTQKIFHAGDEEQFEKYREPVNGKSCIENISLENNIFSNEDIYIWNKYENLDANCVIDTFRYIFNKFKKGIFVKILNNELRVFLPFSKANFTNEWGDRIKVDHRRYRTVLDFLKHITELSGYKFNPRKINTNTSKWFSNNCLLRYEYPISECETNVSILKNMLEELCRNRKLPDIEFFVNRRDFPIITRDGFEPYNNLWGTKTFPLVSHSFEKYSPIFSMSNSERYADLLFPTWEDWARIQQHEGKWFTHLNKNYTDNFDIPWNDRKPTAIFRGTSTGCGVTIETNKRLKAAYISSVTKPDKNGDRYLDAGISKWNTRIRKLEDNDYLTVIDLKNIPIDIADFVSPRDQAKYKYVVNIEGHVSAFRLSHELSSGSVVLLVDSEWKVWYSNKLVPYKHYVPVKGDLSDIIDQIKWCRDNDNKCRQIAINARKFYDKYLQKNGVFDYLQKCLVDLKNKMGIYFYNIKTPLEVSIDLEYKNLDYNHPQIDKNVTDISMIPYTGRTYGLLKGVEWVIRNIIKSNQSFDELSHNHGEIFHNKHGSVVLKTLAGMAFVVKSTQSKDKIKEHVHETYLSTHCINELSKYVPNFVYNFGLYEDVAGTHVITEFVNGGETLYSYIMSNSFNIRDYFYIIIQLCLALQIAQNKVCFVHHDLSPWNIMLNRLDNPVELSYMIEPQKIYKIKTNIIPVIIDYGKSYCVVKGEHHGFIDMFRFSTAQDISTFLITTLGEILKHKRLPKDQFSDVIYLANFMSDMRRKRFDNSYELKDFLQTERKFENLIKNKGQFERKTPMDLFSHVMNMTRKYKFDVSLTNNYTSNMDRSNSRQVYEYIFSNNINDRLKSYENVFIRLKHCSLPVSRNKFFIYYAFQKISDNLDSVFNEMMAFIYNNNIDDKKYIEMYTKTVEYLNKVFKSQIKKSTDIVVYNSDDISMGHENLYNEETFLVPLRIFNVLHNIKKHEDYSDYKDVIINVLMNKGKYQLSDKDKAHFMNMFKDIIQKSSETMMISHANYKTLKNISKIIYTEDLDNLEIIKGDCEDSRRYRELYKQILDIC